MNIDTGDGTGGAMEKTRKPPQGCAFAHTKNSRMQYREPVPLEASLKDRIDMYVQPTNGVSTEGPFEFVMDPVRETVLPMDLLSLYVRGEVVDAGGERLDPASEVCCSNFLLNSMWKTIECRVNGKGVNLSASHNAAYKAIMQAYLTVDGASAWNLLPSLYTPESSSKSSSTLVASSETSTSTRRELLNLGGGDFEMKGPIGTVDMLMADNYLAPFNQLSLTFVRNTDEFIFNTPRVVPPPQGRPAAAAAPAAVVQTQVDKLEEARERLAELKAESVTLGTVPADGSAVSTAARAEEGGSAAGQADRQARIAKLEAEVKALEKVVADNGPAAAAAAAAEQPKQLRPRLVIKDIGLTAHRIEMTPSALVENFRPDDVQRYLTGYGEVHSYALVTGISRKSIQVYASGVLPKQIVVGMVRTSAFVGNYHANPFDFQSFGLNRIALKVNGVRTPQEPLEPDFEKGHIQREFVHMLMNTGKWRTEVGNSITPLNFASGVTLFPFDLTPDSCGSFHLHAGKEGVTEVELSWAEPLDEQVTVLIFTCKDQVVTLDPKGKGEPAAHLF